MWTSVDKPHQIGNLVTVSKIFQNLSSEYFAWAIKRNKETKKIVGKYLLT